MEHFNGKTTEGLSGLEFTMTDEEEQVLKHLAATSPLANDDETLQVLENYRQEAEGE